MSTTGVTINGTDTKTTYGLIMLNDLKVSAPELKDAYVDLPGISGALDFSASLTGYPLYEDREISFTLFKPVDTAALTTLRETFFTNYNGLVCEVETPDRSGFVWKGRLLVGDLDEYNGGRIPITMRVRPYRLKSTTTTVTEALAANTPESIALTNAGMPTIPTFTCTQNCTLTDTDGNTYSITAGTPFTSADLTMTGAGMTITAEAAAAGTLTITYQEGTL